MFVLLLIIYTNSWADRFAGAGFSYIGETEKTIKGTFKPKVRIKNAYSLVFIILPKEYKSKDKAQEIANKEAKRRAKEADQKSKQNKTLNRAK